uniref:NPH3 domain-containing protein n=1 Tax=Oryza rufipogon TaxID=4529 RepID=A0A0E0NUZ8_ORYRU
MGVATVTELRQSFSGKRAFRPTLTSRHANEWPPTDVSSDLTVEVGTSSFALHKLLAQFPLVSRSGKIRRAVAEAKDGKLARLGLHGTPGGATAFELAAKFCYGVGVDVTVGNVAMLRCAAHYLQMTEDFSDKNLELRAEAFLRDAVLPSIAGSVAVLRSCEALLPAAEDVNLVPRLIAAIANNVCKEQLTSGLSKLDQLKPPPPPPQAVVVVAGDLDSPGDWWGKSVAGLGLDFFQRLLSAVKSKGLKQETVTRILINYAQNSLHGLMARDIAAAAKCGGDTDAVKKQRAVVHPNIKEAERYRMCKAIDCQRLTPDACSHAAQNERLPVQMAVQVLYFEQLRLRSAIQATGTATTTANTSIGGAHDAALFFGCAAAAAPASHCGGGMRSGSGVGSGAMSPRDSYASVRRENRELKLEVARMRMRLTDLEKDQVSMRRELVRVGPANRLLRGLARRLGSLFHFRGAAAEPGLQQLGAKATADAKVLFQRRRRHSIS